MEYRYLGRSGLKVPVLSLGSWLTYGDQVDSGVTLECMKTAFELGMTHFDTAEVYGNGNSELEIGNVIHTMGWRRSEFTIGTKLFWGGKGINEKGLSRKHIIEGLSMSLDRLRLDYVDIVFAHRPDLDTPIEETVRAFNFVIEKGMALYWGTSEWAPAQITEAQLIAQQLNLMAPISEQPQYNMFHRDRVEKEYLPLYSRYNLGTMAWSPLGSGILTGKYNEGVPENSRLAIGNNLVTKRMKDWLNIEDGKMKLKKVEGLKKIANKLEASTTQLALAWALTNPNVSTLLTGATNTDQLRHNFKAIQLLPKLTPNILLEIEQILNNKPNIELNFRNT